MMTKTIDRWMGLSKDRKRWARCMVSKAKPFGLYLAVLMISCSVPAFSQQVHAQIQINRAIMGNQDSSPEELETEMRIEIDAMSRVLGLSEGAVKKLEIASIAAVKSAIKKNPPAKLQVFGGGGVNPTPANKNSLSDEDEERKADQNQEERGQGFGFPGPMLPTVNLEAVKKEDIWTKTVTNTLTPSQIEDFKKFQETRKENQKRLAIQNKVDDLDQYLMLSLEQREAMIKVAEKVLGETLVKPRPKFPGGGRLNQVVVMMGAQGDKDLTVEDVKTILSPTQLKEFERQKRLDGAGPLGALPGPNGNQAAGPATVESTSPLGFDAVEKSRGIVVTKVEGGSVAAKAGLIKDDVIDSIDKTPVDTLVQLKRELNNHTQAKALSIVVLRGGKKVTLSLSMDQKE